jgi:hypothetical protein
MVPARVATIGKRNDFEWELLAAQHAKLAIAYQIDRRGTDAREGTKSNERPPDLAPMLVGNTDRLHGSGSGEAEGLALAV